MTFPRIELDSRLLREYARLQGWDVPQGGRAFIWAVRNGVLYPYGSGRVIEVRQGIPDQWDDTIGLAGTVWGMYQGTTDPGARFAKRPMNPKGTAWVTPGVHKFRVGHHKRPRFLAPNALVQDGPMWIRRDRDRDGRPTDSDGPRTHEDTGIHIHEGGSVLRPVGPWSAGCLVLPREEWRGSPGREGFWPMVQAAKQQEWDLLLIDGLLLLEYVKKRA